MKIAYIAGPYRAKTLYGIKKNIEAAEATALKYWKQGYAVLCPHKNTAFFDGEAPDYVWLAGAIELMKRCDVVVMMPNWLRSEGAKAEHRIAVDMGMEIIYDGVCSECGEKSHSVNCPMRWREAKVA